MYSTVPLVSMLVVVKATPLLINDALAAGPNPFGSIVRISPVEPIANTLVPPAEFVTEPVALVKSNVPLIVNVAEESECVNPNASKVAPLLMVKASLTVNAASGVFVFVPATVRLLYVYPANV